MEVIEKILLKSQLVTHDLTPFFAQSLLNHVATMISCTLKVKYFWLLSSVNNLLPYQTFAESSLL